MKMTLGDLREHNVKCIHQPIKVIVNEIKAKPQKVTTEEDVSEKNLQQKVQKI